MRENQDRKTSRKTRTDGSDPNATVSDRVTPTRGSLVSVPSVLVCSFVGNPPGIGNCGSVSCVPRLCDHLSFSESLPFVYVLPWLNRAYSRRTSLRVRRRRGLIANPGRRSSRPSRSNSKCEFRLLPRHFPVKAAITCYMSCT
jgi:hypothetical protein